MRWLRIASLIAALGLAIVIVALYLAYRNQDRLIKLVLDRLEARSGLKITVESARVHLRSHLVVVLERPRIVANGIEVARLNEVRAVVSYHALLFSNGLPLYRITLADPALTVPPQWFGAGAISLPRPNPAVPNQFRAILRQVATVTRRLDVERMSVYAGDGKSVIASGSLTAYHHRHQPTRWYLQSDLHLLAAPTEGVSLRARLVTDAVGDVASNIAVHGDVLFDRDRPTVLTAGTFELTASANGIVNVKLFDDGHIGAHTVLNATEVTLSGGALKSPASLGSGQAAMGLQVDSQAITIPEFSVREDQSEIARGSAALQDAYGPDALLDIRVKTMTITAAAIGHALENWRGAPELAQSIAKAVKAGQVELSGIELKTKLDSLWKSPIGALRRAIVIEGKLANVSGSPLIGLAPVPVTGLNLSLAYSRDVLALSGGSATIGQSRLRELTGHFNLEKLPRAVSYTVRLSGDLAVDEAYRLALARLPDIEKKLHGQIELLGGLARFDMSANGRLNPANPAWPADFVGQLAPQRIGIGLKRYGRAVLLKSGTIAVQPGVLRVERLVVQAAGSNAPGDVHSVTVTTDLSRSSDRLVFHNSQIEFRRVSAQRWMPLFIDPGGTDIQGEISGKLNADGYIGKENNYRVTGQVTIGPGQVQFGFLRAPILTNETSVTLDGRGVRFLVPNGRIEGSRVDLDCVVADFNHPKLELDAKLDQLNLEVMKFIRLPWSPSTPVAMFAIPVDGHLTARHARLSRLVMSDASADYSYNNGDWWVHNLKAGTLGGGLALGLTGRKADNWITIETRIDSIDAGRLMEMIRPGKTPMMIGTINTTANLSANTDIDFFQTMRGKLSLAISHGRLAKFALLSRILGLIDLRNWFTKSASDPRVSGLPFDSITATFDGSNGVFQTDDLRLSGPVMDALAQGKMDLGRGAVDMEIGMVPFSTVSWLMGKIPLIGTNLALSSGTLVAAYAQVHGPIENPKVTAKPITSLTEFIKKTLSLPINVVRPNTVR